METMEPIKPWLDENGVVRVYVSMHNSDPTLYDEFSAKVGGEHYLLKDKEEEDAMFTHLGRTGLPVFRLYGKDGKLAFKTVGYKIGNEGLKTEVEKLL